MISAQLRGSLSGAFQAADPLSSGYLEFGHLGRASFLPEGLQTIAPGVSRGTTIAHTPGAPAAWCIVPLPDRALTGRGGPSYVRPPRIAGGGALPHPGRKPAAELPCSAAAPARAARCLRRSRREADHAPAGSIKALPRSVSPLNLLIGHCPLFSTGLSLETKDPPPICPHESRS